MTDQLPPLTDADRETLKAFLSHPDRPNGTLNYTQFIGLLYSVLSAPTFLSTEQWLPVVFNKESANAEKQSDMEGIILNMVQHYKEAFDDLMEGGCNPSVNLAWSESAEDRIELEHFCQGYVAFFTDIEELWKATIKKFSELDPQLRGELNLEDHVYSIMGLISTLAAPDLNVERAENPQLLQQHMPGFAQQLPEAIYALAQMGGKLEELFQALENPEQVDV
jgi:yecA family protein